ncbi:MAG: Rieske 2Fe-2S domain-containing protein [Kofleriaceae bacterium]
MTRDAGSPETDAPADEPAAPGGDPASTTAPDRRRFLELAAGGLGCGLVAAIAVPAARHLVSPVGRRTVVRASAPIDVGSLEQLAIGAPPVRVPVVAPIVRDAWASSRDVPLGAAWLQRVRADSVVALSSVCPHLGCAIGWDTPRERFVCPCHDSSFTPAGARIHGPSPRDMDALPITVDKGRLRLTWQQFRQGVPGREVL